MECPVCNHVMVRRDNGGKYCKECWLAKKYGYEMVSHEGKMLVNHPEHGLIKPSDLSKPIGLLT